ncbi:hypothetical protein QQG55_41095 [Brugia pahangi]
MKRMVETLYYMNELIVTVSNKSSECLLKYCSLCFTVFVNSRNSDHPLQQKIFKFGSMKLSLWKLGVIFEDSDGGEKYAAHIAYEDFFGKNNANET